MTDRISEIWAMLGEKLSGTDMALVGELAAELLSQPRQLTDEQAERRRASDRERAKERRESLRTSADSADSPIILDNNIQERGVGETKSESPRTILESVVDRQRAEALIEHRKTHKPPLKTYSAGLLAKQLAKFADPNAAADEMIERGWKTIKRDWMKDPPNGKVSSYSASPPKRSWAEIKADRDRA